MVMGDVLFVVTCLTVVPHSFAAGSMTILDCH